MRTQSRNQRPNGDAKLMSDGREFVEDRASQGRKCEHGVVGGTGDARHERRAHGEGSGTARIAGPGRLQLRESKSALPGGCPNRGPILAVHDHEARRGVMRPKPREQVEDVGANTELEGSRVEATVASGPIEGFANCVHAGKHELAQGTREDDGVAFWVEGVDSGVDGRGTPNMLAIRAFNPSEEAAADRAHHHPRHETGATVSEGAHRAEVRVILDQRLARAVDLGGEPRGRATRARNLPGRQAGSYVGLVAVGASNTVGEAGRGRRASGGRRRNAANEGRASTKTWQASGGARADVVLVRSPGGTNAIGAKHTNGRARLAGGRARETRWGARTSRRVFKRGFERRGQAAGTRARVETRTTITGTTGGGETTATTTATTAATGGREVGRPCPRKGLVIADGGLNLGAAAFVITTVQLEHLGAVGVATVGKWVKPAGTLAVRACSRTRRVARGRRRGQATHAPQTPDRIRAPRARP